MTSKLSPVLDALAGELALGVLEGETRAQALRHMASNREFAAGVESWKHRLAPLFHAYDEVSPPDVWPAIEARIDSQLRSKETRQIRFWRASSIITGALAASMAAVMILGPSQHRRDLSAPAPTPAVFAQLAGRDDALLAADLDLGKGQLRIRAIALPASALVPELWVIPGDGVPRSLGMIKPDGISLVKLAPDQQRLIADGAVLAISLEPADGAPHSAPSSTPIATGTITSL